MAKQFMVKGTWKTTGKVGSFGWADTRVDAQAILHQAELAGNMDLMIVEALHSERKDE